MKPLTHFYRLWQLPLGRRIAAIIIALFVCGDVVHGQVTWGKQTLTRGKLWATVWNSLQYGDPTETENGFHTLDYPGYSKGTNINDALNYAEAAGYAIYGVRSGRAYAYTLNSRFFPSGENVFPIEEATLTKNYNLADLNTWGEEIVTGGHHVNGLEVDISRRSMVWSYPKYDDFIIHQVTITNTEFATISDLHFGMRYGVRVTQRSGTRGDEKYGWDAAHQLFYFYDHQSFNFQDETPVQWTFGVGPQRGDISDSRDIRSPGTRETELDAAGYFAAVVLDSSGARVYQNILEHTGQGVTEGAAREDIMFIQEVDEAPRFKEVMTHQQPRRSWDEARAAGGEGGTKYERRPEFLLSVGPLELPPFASIVLVFAEVMGEMDRAKIVQGGVENIDLLATASRDSLLANVRAARELHRNFYLPAYHPPMTPTDGENSLTLTAGPGEVAIAWPPIPESYRDPLKGVNDFAGYRVYRSSYFTIGPWTLIAEIPKESAQIVAGNVQFVDSNLPFGVGNYYCVTSYDTDGYESGKVNNNRFPVYPFRAPNTDFPRHVYVVPNPFRQHSGLLGQGERFRMEFIGLPAKCVIKIYTLTGDLVQEIKHDDGSGSTSWGSIRQLDYQLNRWMLGVAPGVYIYHVESQVSGQEGQSYVGKFAIVK
ncbi:hypothetical protein EDS67_20345 [candidate division KSB1 bacterium]|nr:MAG: hypothetical protein EDS67_20345 [candidate division KSB1 bacterium]MBC6951197.1 hypothetical protein [candidate division KSB1 bacterium]MCE7943692.1 hypothetical protein [Chlorobi bacterium CHB1]